jgi:hypothetical protein
MRTEAPPSLFLLLPGQPGPLPSRSVGHVPGPLHPWCTMQGHLLSPVYPCYIVVASLLMKRLTLLHIDRLLTCCNILHLRPAELRSTCIQLS